MKAAAFVLPFLWLLFPTRASCQTSEGQLERTFHAGQQHMRDGNFARAVEDFNKVLALDPTLIEADVNVGLAYQSLFEYELALRHLTKALRQRPNLLAANVIAGMDYLKLGSAEKAIPYLQQALKLDPSNRDAREALASAYLSQTNFRLAAEQFRQMAALNPDQAEALFKLGHQYLDLAAQLAYRGAHLYRDSAWGHRFLADLLFQRGRWEDALKEYRKAIAIEPAQSGLHASLGRTYLHAKDLPEAEKEFRAELLLDSRDELAWLGLANTQLAATQAHAALESVRKAWDISPEFLEIQREFPSVELTAELAKASIADVQDASVEPAKHFLLANLCAAANDSMCANRELKSFEDDLALRHQQPAPNGGQDACQAHSYMLCIDSLKAQNNLSDAQRLLLGKAYLSLQQYERAADSLTQVQGATRINAEASYWLASTYQAQGTEAYARLQQTFPDSWRACQLRAEGAALRGDIDDAVKEFHAALDRRADEPELHESLGELYLNQHNHDAAAEAELEKALALDPSRTRSLYLLGRLYVQNKDNEKALPYLQRALRLRPDFMEANSLLGTVYIRTGQFAEAIPKLVKAAPSDHYGNVHYQLYIAYRKLGRSELAQKELALSQDLRRSYLERDEALVMGSPQPEPEPR